MGTHRLSKPFNPDLRDLKILREYHNPSVKYDILFADQLGYTVTLYQTITLG